jgi:hypothetical protein
MHGLQDEYYIIYYSPEKFTGFGDNNKKNTNRTSRQVADKVRAARTIGAESASLFFSIP